MIKEPKYLVKFTNAYNDNGTVWYSVQVIATKDGETWTFKERYSRMRNIHENCQKGKWKNDLPAFPPRKLFGNTSEEFIQKRKKELENYYSTLFRTVDIDQLPEVLGFFNTNKPMKEKPKPSQKTQQQDTHNNSQKTEKKQKNLKKTFEEIVVKYEKQMVQSNEFDNDIEDQTRRRFNLEFQKLKLELKSPLIQNPSLPIGDKENDTDFWSEFFKDANSQQLSKCKDISQAVTKELEASTKCNFKFVVAL